MREGRPKRKRETIPDDVVYMHCARCMPVRPNPISPKEWARTQTFVTSAGDLFVWCNRCDIPVARIANHDVAEVLRRLAGIPCAACGESHGAGAHR